ncbi:uncharacterized protein LOC107845081 [Capsicum annuum]|uniref:uncharacterized protein LOC107845081 n=1 Tax=Capsicum annuum TaxID=4072 RepID=UPI001FB1938B|nr:uncharacterized protein LOC107845081 [Capsicum annuum]
MPRPDKSIISTSWKYPSRGLKLNFDGSSNYFAKAGGAGGVFCDANGFWVKGYSARINVNSPLEAELSLFCGLQIAKDMDIFLSLWSPQMKHDDRSQNKLADKLAKEGRKLNLNKIFVL